MFRGTLILAATLTLATPALAEEPAVWAYDRNVSDNPIGTYLGVVYGIPQTDDVGAYLECLIESEGATVDFTLAADVEGLEDGAEVVGWFTAYGARLSFLGSVVRHEEGVWGVSLPFATDADFWHWLRFESEVNFGLEGRDTLTLPITGLVEPLQAFLADCATIRDLRPDAALPPKG